MDTLPASPSPSPAAAPPTPQATTPPSQSPRAAPGPPSPPRLESTVCRDRRRKLQRLRGLRILGHDDRANAAPASNAVFVVVARFASTGIDTRPQPRSTPCRAGPVFLELEFRTRQLDGELRARARRSRSVSGSSPSSPPASRLESQRDHDLRPLAALVTTDRRAAAPRSRVPISDRPASGIAPLHGNSRNASRNDFHRPFGFSRSGERPNESRSRYDPSWP